MKDRPSDATHPPGSPFSADTQDAPAPGSYPTPTAGLTFSRPCGAHIIMRTRPNRLGFMLDWTACPNSLCTPCKRVTVAFKTLKLMARAGP